MLLLRRLPCCLHGGLASYDARMRLLCSCCIEMLVGCSCTWQGSHVAAVQACCLHGGQAPSGVWIRLLCSCCCTGLLESLLCSSWTKLLVFMQLRWAVL